MPFISASAISPYNSIRGGGAEEVDPILAFSPFNVWDSDNVTIDGTTTTFHDYNEVGEALNLQNPSASNQPTFNASSNNFNSKPSFTFDGVSQYVSKSISSYETNSNKGVFISVAKDVGAGNKLNINISDINEVSRYFNLAIANGDKYRVLNFPTAYRSYQNGTDVSTSIPRVVSNGSDSTQFKMWINNTPQTITMLAGSNDGLAWLDTFSAFNYIGIGAIHRSGGITFATGEWVFSGYFPYENDAKVLEIINILMQRYGIT